MSRAARVLFVGALSAIITGIKGQCGNDTYRRTYALPDSKQFFFSPDYPDPYPSNASCQWLLETNEGYRFRLRPMYFQLESSNVSCVDNFTVYDGNSTIAPVLYSSCQRVFTSVNSSTKYLLVSFTSGQSKSGSQGGFLISYETFREVTTTTTSTTTASIPGSNTTRTYQCGRYNLTARAGQFAYLTSPEFPDTYPNNAACEWRIMADSAHDAVRLDIVKVDMEESPNCTFDSITIYDVFATKRIMIKRFCSYLDSPVYSKGDYLIVTFTSDSSISGRGFQLTYTSVAKPTSTSPAVITQPTTTTTTSSYVCSTTAVTLTAPLGHVGNLNFPYTYLDNLECVWLIRTDSSLVIKVTVENVSTETCSTCFSCGLRIYDGPSASAYTLGKVCDMTSDTVFYSTGPVLLLSLYSGWPTTPVGLKIRYESATLPVPCTSNRTSYLTAPLAQQNVLKFPSYADNEIRNICDWQIVSIGSNYVVRLTFDRFTTRYCSRPDCTCGSLAIYDGPSTDFPGLAVLCGTDETSRVFVTSGRSTYLHLQTYWPLDFKAFTLRYESVLRSPVATQSASLSERRFTQSATTPSHLVTDQTTDACSVRPLALSASYDVQRTLASPGFPSRYPSNADCNWVITADPGYVIELTPLSIALEKCDDCNCDKVQIFDGPMAKDRLKVFCSQFTESVYSSGNTMYIRFSTNSMDERSGFSFLYRAVVPSSSSDSSPNGNFLKTVAGSSTQGVALAGGIFGGSFLLVIVVVVVIYCACRKRCQARHKKRGKGDSTSPRHGNTEISTAPLNPTAPPATEEDDIGHPSTSPTVPALYPVLAVVTQGHPLQAPRDSDAPPEGATASLTRKKLKGRRGRDNPAFTSDSSETFSNIETLDSSVSRV